MCILHLFLKRNRTLQKKMEIDTSILKKPEIPHEKSHYFSVNGSDCVTILVSTAPLYSQFWRQWLQTFHYFRVNGSYFVTILV